MYSVMTALLKMLFKVRFVNSIKIWGDEIVSLCILECRTEIEIPLSMTF